MQNYFQKITEFISSNLGSGEVFKAYFSGEKSDFVRFNNSKIRQPGSVTQMAISLDLIKNLKHISNNINLSGILEQDQDLISKIIKQTREDLKFVSDDPYLLISNNSEHSENIESSELGSAAQITQNILLELERAGTNKPLDFVGILAMGQIYKGFSSSHGAQLWHERSSFNLDYSLYYKADKAVKNNYAGKVWDAQKFRDKLTQDQTYLKILERPAKTLKPNKYRAYLAPAAVHEIVGLMSWGGFSEAATRQKDSPLQMLCEKEKALSPKINMTENSQNGIGPLFQGDGFRKPESVKLIKSGKLESLLISPRSEKEYKKPNNGSSDESPHALDMQPGDLNMAEAAQKLGTGILINNLWYLNFSDKPAGRMTGMTRFATFWVENGEIVAPTNVMRFDDSIYNVFGENLESLTSQRDYIIDSSTYEERSCDTAHLPGAMLKELNLTL